MISKILPTLLRVRARLAQRKKLLTRDTNNSKSISHPSLVPAASQAGRYTKWRQEFEVSFLLHNCSFIHIGKCGGSSLMHSFLESHILVNEIHMSKPPPDDAQFYFVWIRDPIARFVSAFNHSKEIMDFDISNIDTNNLKFSNCPAPGRISRRIKTGHAFSPEYEYLLGQFATANELAEALTSRVLSRRSAAHALMLMPDEHIFKGIGWYLDNGRWVEKFHQNVLFVGTVENMDADFAMLLDKLNIERNVEIRSIRQGSKEYATRLSDQAITNLKRFYQKSDFKALSALKKYNLINAPTFEKYRF